MSMARLFDINDFHFGNNLYIDASAGTGKTYTIQQLVAKLVRGENGHAGKRNFRLKPRQDSRRWPTTAAITYSTRMRAPLRGAYEPSRLLSVASPVTARRLTAPEMLLA